MLIHQIIRGRVILDILLLFFTIIVPALFLYGDPYVALVVLYIASPVAMSLQIDGVVFTFIAYYVLVLVTTLLASNLLGKSVQRKRILH